MTMYVSFSLRLKAFLIDYIFIFIYLTFIIFLSIFPQVRELFMGSNMKAQLIGFLIVTLPVSLYFIIGDSVIGKQTFGKRRIGIQVVNQMGEGLSVIHSILRTSLKFLPWEMSHYLVYRLVDSGDRGVTIADYIVGSLIYILIFVYILTLFITKKKRSLYDILVGTYVIKKL